MLPAISRLSAFHATAFSAAAFLLVTAPASADTEPFELNVRQYFQKYCIECHSTAESKGGMDLEVIQRPEDFLEHPTALTHAIDVLEAEEMPPAKAKNQPTPLENERALAWLNTELNRQRNAAPNDPGIVVAPRLNSNEFGNALRDLFGITQFDASQFLTPEGGAGEGFANVGEAQNMGTSQFESYLTAATRVLAHARITPQSGLVWYPSPQPETTNNADLVKTVRQNWLDWHSKVQSEVITSHVKTLEKSTGLTWGAYAERSWQLHHASALKLPWKSIEDAANGAEPKLFPEALDRYHTIFTGKGGYQNRTVLDAKFLAAVRQRWSAITPATVSTPEARRTAFQNLETFYNDYLQSGRWTRGRGKIEDIPGSGLNFPDIVQPWEGGVARFPVDLTKVTTGEVVITLADAGDGNEDDYVLLTEGLFTLANGSTKPWQDALPAGLMTHQGATLSWGTDTAPGASGKLGAGELGVRAPLMLKFKVPPGATRFIVTVKLHPRFKNSSVIPGIDDAPPEIIDGRLLTRRVLGAGQSERARTFDREFGKLSLLFPEFGKHLRSLRPNNAFTDLPWLNASAAAALEIPWPQEYSTEAAFRVHPSTLRAKATPAQRAEIDAIAAQLRELAATPDDAVARRAAASLIQSTATRAWRRPPTSEELADLGRLYDTDKAAGLPYDFAVKTALKAILVSPDFLYRFQASQNSTKPYLIADLDLADRLSFFLWAAPPDDELLALARAGKLQDPATLKLQAKRLLADPRAAALATEFTGHWLHFAGFDAFTGPDAAKFPDFTPELRQAMYDEIRLFTLDLIQNNRSLENLILADYTFANETLAKHYGLPGDIKGSEMRRVSTAGTPRGGLLAMGSFLTHRSNPLRTSPVKRGVWVYEQILGVRLPPPPPVPTLSDSETNEEGLTIAKQLELHRAKPECASCHDKFDALGFALENFDPIGRWRTKDGAGNPLETKEKLGSGKTVDGLDGLRAYIRARLDEVILTYCRKLTGYALGRGILVTDKPLLDQMVAAVKASGNTPQAAIGVLLESPQFRFRRDESALAAK
jgi:hypothetical protein